MTRKQFLRRFPYLQRNDKRILLNVVRRYGGKLSYNRFFMLLYMAMRSGRRSLAEAIGFVSAVMWEA